MVERATDIPLDERRPHLPQVPLRELCQRYDITFKKGLGQNLLLDDNINRIMVDAADVAIDDAVLEVGAGLGALTRRLAMQAGHLLSVEIDPSFIPCLESQFGHLAHVHIFRGDILNHELGRLISEYLPAKPSYKFLSNLPYYITTPILFHVLESPLYFSRLVVMMQLEVGERLIAAVNSENYGVLALAGRMYADIDIVHQVPASCFLPKPKVDSCIVRFRCFEAPKAGANTPFTMRLIRAAFSQRRKTLRNSLIKSGQFGAPQEIMLAAFEETCIDPGRRPQTLDLDEFIGLAASAKRMLDAHNPAPAQE
ncbi:MAG: ribosomal RNA small subunit methyltransferase A [Candidatus Hydrogenedens sp.]|nr:ribosomal RNA small subunit methyltransferase A [Candidatus Hydrogenedens sp.]